MMEGENRAQRLGGFGWRCKRGFCRCSVPAAIGSRHRCLRYGSALTPNNTAAPLVRSRYVS
jgi:hypothetical protein